MIDTLKPLIKQFIPFAKEKMGFEKPPKLFLKTDSENANNPLGKTAFYDPTKMAVTIYTTNRHPKDIMRSLSHELVHHTQNCRGDFDNVSEMGEGYAQNDEHLREMEREAYEVGNMCFRDWEDSIKSTIYFEQLQKGVKSSMSTKNWKNKELRTILSEAWGFKFNTLEEFNEFNGTGEIQEEAEEAEMQEEGDKPDFLDVDKDGDKEESMKDAAADGDDEKEQVDENDSQAFAPNHYCIHHGGVQREGKTELAEAVSHNWNEELSRVTHYDMKFEDGTIMKNVPSEEIQITNASLAEGHGHPAKRDEEDEEIEEQSKTDRPDRVAGRDTAGRRLSISEERLREIIKHAIKEQK